jgi:hypothetical protein
VNKCQVEINATDVDFSTPLHYAVFRRHAEVVSFLVKKGGRECLYFVDDQNKIPVILGLHQKAPLEVLLPLVHAHGKDKENQWFTCVIDEIIHHGRLDVLRVFVDEGYVKVWREGTEDGEEEWEKISPDELLSSAVWSGQLHIIRWLVEEKNARVSGFRHICKRPLEMFIHTAAILRRLDVFMYLIQECGQKAHVDVPTLQGRTCLRYAVAHCHLPIVRFLIEEAGAKVNPVDRDGDTPLSFAVTCHRQVAAGLQGSGTKEAYEELISYLSVHTKRHRLRQKRARAAASAALYTYKEPVDDWELALEEEEDRQTAEIMRRVRQEEEYEEKEMVLQRVIAAVGENFGPEDFLDPSRAGITEKTCQIIAMEGEKLNAEAQDREREEEARRVRNQKRREKMRKAKAKRASISPSPSSATHTHTHTHTDEQEQELQEVEERMAGINVGGGEREEQAHTHTHTQAEEGVAMALQMEWSSHEDDQEEEEVSPTTTAASTNTSTHTHTHSQEADTHTHTSGADAAAATGGGGGGGEEGEEGEGWREREFTFVIDESPSSSSSSSVSVSVGGGEEREGAAAGITTPFPSPPPSSTSPSSLSHTHTQQQQQQQTKKKREEKVEERKVEGKEEDDDCDEDLLCPISLELMTDPVVRTCVCVRMCMSIYVHSFRKMGPFIFSPSLTQTQTHTHKTKTGLGRRLDLRTLRPTTIHRLQTSSGEGTAFPYLDLAFIHQVFDDWKVALVAGGLCVCVCVTCEYVCILKIIFIFILFIYFYCFYASSIVFLLSHI